MILRSRIPKAVPKPSTIKLYNCFINQKVGDSFLTIYEDDHFEFQLDGYAIIPMEEYERLKLAHNE